MLGCTGIDSSVDSTQFIRHNSNHSATYSPLKIKKQKKVEGQEFKIDYEKWANASL